MKYLDGLGWMAWVGWHGLDGMGWMAWVEWHGLDGMGWMDGILEWTGMNG